MNPEVNLKAQDIMEMHATKRWLRKELGVAAEPLFSHHPTPMNAAPREFWMRHNTKLMMKEHNKKFTPSKKKVSFNVPPDAPKKKKKTQSLRQRLFF